MRITTWAAAAAIVLTACGDGDQAGGLPSASLLIGPAGGTVELAGGGKVEIPAGALNESRTITVKEIDPATIAPLPDNLEAAGKPYAFEPHGQNFAVSVKVELPFTGDASEVRPVKLDDAADTSWSTVFPSAKDTASGKVSLDTTGFSIYWAVRPRRNSGVITLPDGAIDDGGSVSPTDAATGMDADVDAATGPDAGTDAMAVIDAATALDATVDDAGTDSAVAAAAWRVVFSQSFGLEPPDDLYLIGEDGTGLVTLAATADDEGFAAVTATGKVIFRRFIGGQADLFAVDADGTNPVTLTSSSDDEFFSAVTPDGRVIYTRHTINNGRDLYAVNADGTGTTPLATTTSHEDFDALTPGGRVIFHVTISSENADIYSIDVNGGSATPLAADGANEYVQGVTSTGLVIFARYNPFGTGGVYSIADSGGSATTLATNVMAYDVDLAGITTTDAVILRRNNGGPDNDLFGPGLVPLANSVDREDYRGSTSTGQVIFQRSDQAGQVDLYLINPDGTGLAALADDPVAPESFVTIAPNQRIIYTDGAELYAVDRDGTDVAPLTTSADYEELKGVTVDNRVIYERTESNVTYLYAVNTDGTNVTPLVTSGGHAFFVAATPSGKVLFRRQAGNADLYSINTDGTGMTPLAATGNDEFFYGLVEPITP